MAKRLGVLLSAVAVIGALVLQGANGQTAAGDKQRSSSTLDSIASIRAIDLVDQDGKSFHFGQVLGKIVLLNFVFTGCGDVCPTQTADLAEIARKLPDDVRNRVEFVSVSVDPEHDFPAGMRQFALDRGADLDRWAFVSGHPASIRRVSDFFNGALPPGQDPIANHSAVLQVFNAEGHGMQRYPGAPVNQQRILADLVTLSQMSPADR